MPLFHSNAQVAGYTAPLAAGATTVLRRRFSASGFLPDVRKYGVTFFNYVGKPLTYVLATPPQPDDADNPLRIAFGNEAAPLDIDRFAERVRLHRRRRVRLDRGRHQHVEDRRHAARFARHADRRASAPRSSTPTPAIECAARAVRRARTAAQRRGGDRRDRQPRRRGQLRGLLQQPRGERRAHARRQVLDRRPRLPRRSRLLLLRGPQLRLAARRRRELRRRAGRAGRRAPSRRRARRGVRGAVARRRRRGDARRAPARRRARSTRTDSPRSSKRSPTCRRSGSPASCASRTDCRRPRRRRCSKRVLQTRALGVRRRRVVAARSRRRVPAAHADDVATLRARFAERNREHLLGRA